jgi:hypothetical protein
MQSLYNLTANYKNIANLLDDETMEPEIITTALAEINGSITEKAANIAGLIKNYDSDADAKRAEIKRLTDSLRVDENKSNWLKAYIKENMERLELDKIKVPLWTFSLAKNPPSVEVDMGLLPKAYIIETISQAPDKKMIKAALKLGVAVPGAHLEQGVSLRIK